MTGNSGLFKNTYGARMSEIKTTNALIKVEGDNVALLPSASAMLKNLDQMAEEIKAKQDELKQRILAEMEANGIIKLETDDVTITYVGATDKERFDGKAFRKDHPDLYDDYVTINTAKAYVKVKSK